MGALSREAILARKIGHEQVELSGGDYVVVRALKRSEMLAVKGIGGDGDDVAAIEARDNFIISVGMIDPQLTADEVAQLGETLGAADLGKISQRIGQLSGMLEDSGKQATKSVPRRRK